MQRKAIESMIILYFMSCMFFCAIMMQRYTLYYLYTSFAGLNLHVKMKDAPGLRLYELIFRKSQYLQRYLVGSEYAKNRYVAKR